MTQKDLTVKLTNISNTPLIINKTQLGRLYIPAYESIKFDMSEYCDVHNIFINFISRKYIEVEIPKISYNEIIKNINLFTQKDITGFIFWNKKILTQEQIDTLYLVKEMI